MALLKTLPVSRELARSVAYDWHSGQFSPLYAFASTGRVQSEQHRINALTEARYCLDSGIRANMASQSSAETRRDEIRLCDLIQYLDRAPVEG